MAASQPRPATSSMTPIQSLRVRLPLLISLLLTAAVTVILWAAYREVEATLVRAGGDRARGAADQVANLLASSTQAELGLLRPLALDPRMRRFVRDPTSDNRSAAQNVLATLDGTGIREVDVWNSSGSRLLTLALPMPNPKAPRVVLPPSTRPVIAGFGPLQSAGKNVYTDTVVEIPHLGYLVSRSTISVNPPGILNRLVGSDAVIEMGNAAGGTWTDLSRIVSAPPVSLSRSSVAQYQTRSGDKRLGAVSLIGGTPWVVWVEFPLSEIVAPAQIYVERMIVLVLIVVVVGAALAAVLSVRITSPLHELAQAAAGIAGGDYSQRVEFNRPDEIGRLAEAFNAMVAEVKDAQTQLEARVLERSRALEALRASEEHFRTIVEVALDCIITIDAAGRVIEFNPAAETTFGYKKADVVGQELADLIVPPANRDAHRKGLARYISTGRANVIGRRIEMTAMRSDGTLFPVELALSAIRSGDTPIITGMVRDTTERKRVEEIRAQIQAMEEQNLRTIEANRLKSQFLANMSHELRTPLNAIIGFTELMHRGMVGPLSPEQREFLGDILTSSKHLLQLINDILDLAKVESGKMEFRPEPIDLTRLVTEVRDALRVLAAGQGLRIVTDVSREVDNVVADEARLKQILFNYMSNAVKFTPVGGEVRVSIAPEGPDKFRIDVKDTGIGIPAEDLDKLFAEFQQLDAGYAKRHQGTGLGLALVKRIAEAQGGSVSVVSEVGKGSTFSAILPRVATTAAGDDAAPSISTSSGNRTILIVDDDPATLKLADITLRDAGYRPVCKANAKDALWAFQADPPAVVIADLLMPNVDGFDFISQLRAASGGAHVPVIVWTVKDLDADERSLLALSAAAVVSKRAGGSQELVDAIRRLVPPEPLRLEGTSGT